MKIFITGGSGFIGTRLQRQLRDSGHELRVYDLVHSPRNLTGDVIIGDIRDLGSLSSAMAGCDYVIHLAAEHKDNVTPVELYDQVNVAGAENVIKAMDIDGISKVLFTSSSAVYPLVVDHDPSEQTQCQPFNCYGMSKFNAENVFRQWYDSKPQGRQLIIVRPCVVFGEHNRGNIYLMLQQIYRRRFMVIGDGKNLKSVNYVGNIVSFFDYVIQELADGSYLFNYADKPDMTTGQMVSVVNRVLGRGSKIGLRIPYLLGLLAGAGFDLLSKLTGKKFPISVIRVRKFRVSLCFDNSRAMATGFKPPYSLEEAFERTVRFEFCGENVEDVIKILYTADAD